MSVEDLKWYSPIVLLAGAILSFADPITDILTLVKFYRADHKTWFGVGLAFVILPCLVFPILYLFKIHKNPYSGTRKCAQTILCASHPFSAALARLQGFVFGIKKWWRCDAIDSVGSEDTDDLLEHIDFAVLFESVLESIPQFIIQLYAMSVQEEPVEVIQMISLPISFLSLAWAFTTVDKLTHHKAIGNRNIAHKLALFVAHTFLLSSRLFAVCYFTVSYKWWVIGVLLIHSSLIVITDTIWFCQKGECGVAVGVGSALFFCLYCLRDDIALRIMQEKYSTTELKRIQLFSNVLFVLENVVMILLFYFSQHSNTWYSLPVTVCVCLFSVLGSVMRVIHFHFLYKDASDDTVNSQLSSSIDSPPETLYWISTV
ncbi:XK-related protein 6-like [Oculina patagonica]